MKISTKGRYGLRALIDICIYSSAEMVTVKSISERQGISERYLEQIFSSLRKGGIINAKKGAQGGYFLAKSAREFTIGDILSVLEGDLLLIDIEKDENGRNGRRPILPFSFLFCTFVGDERQLSLPTPYKLLDEFRD